jgi:agmatine deiminase
MRFPGEWEPHERTIMGWPCRRELWGETLAEAKADYATVANAIAAFEPVTMIANPGPDAAEARAALSGAIDVVELPLDDSWLRDSGPIYVVEDGAARTAESIPAHPGAPEERLAVHFRFNAWGEKFPPWDRDAAVGALIAEALGDPVRPAPIVLEGGSVIADGAGTVLTTEQCLLHPSRNPTLSREQIEAALTEYLGAQRVLWLGQGLLEDRDTDGHVDLIAAYTPEREVLLQTVPEDNPNYGNCQTNLARLAGAGVPTLVMPYLPYVEVAGEPVAASYMNLYICNGAVIVPVTGADTDPAALAIIAGAFPGREIVGVAGAVIAYGGGGPHCITQQVPEVRAGD